MNGRVNLHVDYFYAEQFECHWDEAGKYFQAVDGFWSCACTHPPFQYILAVGAGQQLLCPPDTTLGFLRALSLLFISPQGKWRRGCERKRGRKKEQGGGLEGLKGRPHPSSPPTPRVSIASPKPERIWAELPRLYHLQRAESSRPQCIAESRKANSCCSLIWVKIVSVFSLAHCFRRDWQLGQTKSFHWLPSQPASASI